MTVNSFRSREDDEPEMMTWNTAGRKSASRRTEQTHTELPQEILLYKAALSDGRFHDSRDEWGNLCWMEVEGVE